MQALRVGGSQVEGGAGRAQVGHGCCLSERCGSHAAMPRRYSSTMPPKETDMTWTTPAYTELRLGFEITMYIANR
jgi:pyrroloquinoline quinone biosynthesis protein A